MVQVLFAGWNAGELPRKPALCNLTIRQTVRALFAGGATVAINDLDIGRAERLGQKLERDRGAAFALAGDTSRESGVRMPSRSC